MQRTRGRGRALSSHDFPGKRKICSGKRARSYATAHRDGLFFILVLHRNGFRFVSFVLVRLFLSSVSFCAFRPLSSVHVVVGSTRSFSFYCQREMHMRVSPRNLPGGSCRKSVCPSTDDGSRINRVSTLVCLVDWQRCTQTRYSCAI